jgi:hypothetical protein
MKDRICIFFALLITTHIFAQKVITDGTLTYNISIESIKGEKQIASTMNDAVLTLSLSKDKSRTDVLNKVGTETTVFDSKLGKGFLLKEYSGQKLMITASAENWAQKNKVFSNLSFTIDNSKTTIGAYNCKKATAVNEGKTYTVYFDESTTLANKSYNNAFPQLNGLPVQYETQFGNLIFKYTLAKISMDIIAATKFDAPKPGVGFRTMTYEENQQLKKGEQGK